MHFRATTSKSRASYRGIRNTLGFPDVPRHLVLLFELPFYVSSHFYRIDQTTGLFCFKSVNLACLSLSTARLRLLVDCAEIKGPCPQEGATGGIVTQQEGQTVQKEETSKAQALRGPQGVVEGTAAAGLEQESVRRGAVRSSKEVLNSIAIKYLQQVNHSTPEEFNEFIQYMEKVRKVIVVDVHTGSLILILECSSLQILDELWEDYCTGHLNEVAQKFLVTEEILKEFGLAEVKLTTTIIEEEYKACRELFLNLSSKYLDLIMNPKYTYRCLTGILNFRKQL